MIEGGDHSVVADEEQLARFILFSNWVRSSNQTVRPDAFIPHPYPDLSVTRHCELSEEAIWKAGQDVANTRPATLYGRADINAVTVQMQNLKIVSAPTASNHNHANIIDWPANKPAQKIIAMELAANSVYRAKP